MAASIEPPTRHVKRKRSGVAKNRKKAWRKHSNIQDVEDFIEDQRLQLRTGGIVAEKPDEDLFFVDKKQPTKEDGKKNLEKPLKYERRLMPDSRIPAARKPKTPKAVGRPTRKSKLVQRLEKEDKWGPTSTAKRRKIAQGLKESDAADKRKDDEVKSRETGRATYDLWGGEAPTESKKTKKNSKEVIEPSEHFLRVTKKMRAKLPRTYHERTSVYDTVEVVHPGASYNPTFEDHQELIQKAVQVEEDREKKEDKINRWHNFPKISKAEVERIKMTEMSEGLFDDRPKAEGEEVEDEEEGDGEKKDEDEDAVPSAPVIAERRKTKRQRNKEKEVKKLAKQAQAEKTEKIRLNEVYRLRALKREITAKESKTATKKAEKMAKAAERKGKTKRLGRYKYEELPIPVKMTQHLVGNLRRLKPEGSLLADRFNNLQKRNMIEPRIWKRGTKPKMKEYEKKSFKEIKTAV